MNATVPDSERIRAYLDHAMSAADEERFELALFDEPELAEAVHAERLLREGLREIEARRAAAVVVPLPQPQPRAAVPQWLYRAAAFVGGALIGGLVMQLNAPVPAAAHGKAQVVALQQLRSLPDSPDAVLQLQADTPNLVLQFVQAAAANARDYRFELAADGAAPLLIPGLRPGADTKISINLATADLSPGRYEARLIEVGNDGSERQTLSQTFVLQRGAAPR